MIFLLLTDTVIGLQNHLNTLAIKSAALDLQVNLDKSNIVIFRNGGYISKKEKWHYIGHDINIVNTYKYLGLFLTTRMTFSSALSDMANRAKKGIIDIVKTLWRLGIVRLFFFLNCLIHR